MVFFARCSSGAQGNCAMSLPATQIGHDLSIAEAREFALETRISADPEVAAAFWDEVSGCSPAGDVEITVFYCFIKAGSAMFTLLEFVSGQTLEQLGASEDPSTCERVIPLFCRMLDACDAAALESLP